jgi:hypothetical protein
MEIPEKSCESKSLNIRQLKAVQELKGRSRMLLIDLMKLGITLCTGSIAGLSLFILKFDDKDDYDVFEPLFCLYSITLIILLLSITSGIIGWFAQARVYYFKAKEIKAEIDDNTIDLKEHGEKKEFWKEIRTSFMIVFCVCFILGIIGSGIFIRRFIKSDYDKAHQCKCVHNAPHS